ncbi:MAG: hypothetical protein J6D54_07025 [Olsenella sp.]|nr:hypothetical protein [Olsenella sp.]
MLEETAAAATPFAGKMPPLEKLECIAPLSFANVSPSRPVDVVFPDGDTRHRSAEIRCQVCGIARAGSFVRLGVSPRELEEAGLPKDLRLYIDSPGRIFLVAAQTLSRLIHTGRIESYEAFLRLLSLGSELCGSYARDPKSPHEGKIVYRIPQATTVSEISRYLARCKGNRGLSLAKKATQYLVDGIRSPLECEFYFALTLPPRLGGIGFPLPLVNKPLELEERTSDITTVKSNRFARTQNEPHGSTSFSHYDEITPDMHWPLPEQGLVIEVDGYFYHSDREAFVNDRFRDQDYKSCGYQVLRITYENMADVGTLEKTLALVVQVAEPWLSQSRVKNLRRSIRKTRESGLRAILISILGPGKR